MFFTSPSISKSSVKLLPVVDTVRQLLPGLTADDQLKWSCAHKHKLATHTGRDLACGIKKTRSYCGGLLTMLIRLHASSSIPSLLPFFQLGQSQLARAFDDALAICMQMHEEHVGCRGWKMQKMEDAEDGFAEDDKLIEFVVLKIHGFQLLVSVDGNSTHDQESFHLLTSHVSRDEISRFQGTFHSNFKYFPPFCLFRQPTTVENKFCLLTTFASLFPFGKIKQK